MMRVILLAALILLPVTTQNAVAQSPPPVPAPEATVVRAAFFEFLDAMEAGDAAALRRLIDSQNDIQDTARSVFADVVAARKALERAAGQKFGEDGKRLRSGYSALFNPADRTALSRVRLYYFPNSDGKTDVRMDMPGQTSPIQMRRVGRPATRPSDPQADPPNWQVVLDILEMSADERIENTAKALDRIAGDRIDRLRAIQKATVNVTKGIESGQWTTAAAAEAELTRQLSDLNKKPAAGKTN